VNGVVAGLRALIERPGDATLAVPWLLVPALILVALAAALAIGRTSLPALSFARGEAASKLPKGAGHIARMLAFASLIVSALLVSLAVARPQVLGEPEPGTMEGIDIVVALDISGSMRAADFRPQDRLFVAKRVIRDHLLTRPRDRVGLVVFAGEAFTQSPLTHDHSLVADILDAVRTGVITDGTAIGDGLATALNRLKDSKARTRAVILLTDGDNNAGTLAPETATDLADDLGIKLLPILVGKGGKVPFPDGTDIFGAPRFVTVDMPVNPTLLKSIATRTGTTFFNATDEASLKTSFTKILDGLDRSLLAHAKPVRRPLPLASLLYLPAALLALLGIALSLTRASTVP
jgi:Ca-activated chloride channel family protein